MKLDALHCALLAAIVLIAVYVSGSFREGFDIPYVRVEKMRWKRHPSNPFVTEGEHAIDWKQRSDKKKTNQFGHVPEGVV